MDMVVVKYELGRLVTVCVIWIMLPSIVRLAPSLCSMISAGGAVLVSQVRVRMELETRVRRKR